LKRLAGVKAVFILGVLAGIVVGSAGPGWGAEGGTRPLSMGGAFVALADDVHSVTWNPAGMAWQEDSEVTFSAVLNNRDQYISGDFISDDYIAAVVPLKAGWRDNFHSWGAAGVYFHNSGMDTGSSQLNVYQPGVSYGCKFPGSETMAWGASLSYYMMDGEIPGASETEDALSVNLGYLWYVWPQMSVGFLWENVNEPSYTLFGNSARLVRVLRPGVAYYFDEETVVTLDMYDATGNTRGRGADFSQDLRMGFEHYWTDWLATRLGLHNFFSAVETSTYVSFGIGLERSDYMGMTPIHYYLDYSVMYWPDAVSGMQNVTHQVGVTFRF